MTLIDCIIVEQIDVVNIEQLSKSKLEVGCVFWGTHFDTEEISFSAMTFSVEGLDEWFGVHYRPFSSEWGPAGQSGR